MIRPARLQRPQCCCGWRFFVLGIPVVIVALVCNVAHLFARGRRRDSNINIDLHICKGPRIRRDKGGERKPRLHAFGPHQGGGWDGGPRRCASAVHRHQLRLRAVVCVEPRRNGRRHFTEAVKSARCACVDPPCRERQVCGGTQRLEPEWFSAAGLPDRMAASSNPGTSTPCTPESSPEVPWWQNSLRRLSIDLGLHQPAYIPFDANIVTPPNPTANASSSPAEGAAQQSAHFAR